VPLPATLTHGLTDGHVLLRLHREAASSQMAQDHYRSVGEGDHQAVIREVHPAPSGAALLVPGASRESEPWLGTRLGVFCASQCPRNG
jgi:hypothetical protein